MRRISAIALTALLALGLGACGSDAKKAAAPTTTTTAPKVTTTSSVASTTTTTKTDAVPTTSTTRNAETTTTREDTTDTTEAPPVDNETFAQIIDELQTQLDAATSACDMRRLVEANANIAKPANAAQTKLAIEYLVVQYTKMADTAPPGEATNAAAFRTFAKKIQEFAASKNYDPAAFESDDGPFKDESMVQPMLAFFSATDACPGAS